MENEFTDKFPSSKRVPFVHSEIRTSAQAPAM